MVGTARTLLITLLLALLIGCAARSGNAGSAEKAKLVKPIPVVVLPFENETTDLAAGELARLLFMLGLQEKGYEILGLGRTDSLLQGIGITQGGQLGAVPTEKLTDLFDTRGLVYGNLLQAEYSTKGISTKKMVTMNIRVMKGGEEIWMGEGSAKTGGGLTGPMSSKTNIL